MKQGLTELVFILDRSGSMNGLESDTIGGYNSLLEKQKKEPGEAVITTVLFDNQYELLHDRINIRGIAPITEKDYYVRGNTALLDAIGKTIHKISNVQKNTLEEERAEHVMLVIITDGLENASREFRRDKVRRMIEHQKSKHGWEFIFLGANIDAIAAAEKFGIDESRAANFHADRRGIALNFAEMSGVVSCLRSNHCLADNWKERIEKDFTEREGKQ